MPIEQDLYVFELKQGDTKTFEVIRKFQGQVLPVTDWGARYQARKKPEDPAALSLTHTSGITITASEAKFRVKITDEQSAAMAPGIYFADLFGDPPSGDAEFLVGTKIIVKARYTQ